MELDCVVRGGTVVFPEREALADIAIRDGRIAAILDPGEATGPARESIDASGRHVFPGLIDPHLHFGFAEPIEEFRTETASAAIGGLTSTIAYLLSSDPYSEIFQQAVEDCAARAHIDFAFHCSIATETHLDEFDRYVRDFGVTSFKHFMNFKGEEGRYMGLAGTDDGFMYDLMQTAAGHEHVVIVTHPENIEVVNRIKAQFIEAGRDGLKAYCQSKPTFIESENMVRAMHFAEHLGAHVYFPHVSCADGFEEVRRFRRRYGRVLVETCPHYLTHDWDSDRSSLDKANPPLRSPEDVEATWAALAGSASLSSTARARGMKSSGHAVPMVPSTMTSGSRRSTRSAHRRPRASPMMSMARTAAPSPSLARRHSRSTVIGPSASRVASPICWQIRASASATCTIPGPER